MPCRACLAEARNAQLPKALQGRNRYGFGTPLAIDLRDHHKARYESVRANRPVLEQDEPQFPFR